MSLIDLNGSLGRIDGGFGISLTNPHFRIEFSDECNGICIEGQKFEYNKLIPELIRAIEGHFNTKFEKVAIKIIETVIPHVGFGSKTQFLLTITKGLCHLKGIHPSIEELARLVHRGGTSGIGTRAFEHGGFIVDVGHSFGPGKEKESFLPSSASFAPPAPLLFQFKLPDYWRIILVHFQVKPGANNIEEINHFQQNCPISVHDVEQISHRVLMQIIPAIMSADLTTLAEGLWFINFHGFKHIEIKLQHTYIQKEMQYLHEHYVEPIGMSSFGPILYLITESQQKAEKIAQEIELQITSDPDAPKCTITICTPNNTGHSVIEY